MRKARRVLIIGPEGSLRDRLTELASAAGWRSRALPPGGRALNAVQELLPDAILLLVPPDQPPHAYINHIGLSDYAGPLLVLSDLWPDSLPRSLQVRRVFRPSTDPRQVMQALREVRSPGTRAGRLVPFGSVRRALSP